MSCPKGLITVAESAHLQCDVQLCETDNISKVSLNQNAAFRVSMSKEVPRQHKNKSLNRSQNREVWILGELL